MKSLQDISIAIEEKTPNNVTVTKRRIESVDLLRGIVMVLMALDHVRHFFTNVPFQPENMQSTNGILFFTRWLTHFCAPIFFLLAGTGASLALLQGKSLAELSHFLWTRGLWLIFLELTVMGFGWSFVPGASFAGVIWALGWSMVIMSFAVRFSLRWIAGLGSAMILLHNLTDGLRPETFGSLSWLWGFLHVRDIIKLPLLNFDYYVLFPLVPLIGVMMVGYALGGLFSQPAETRQKQLLWLGWLMIFAFVILRVTNWYGDPAIASTPGGQGRFAPQSTFVMTIVAFLNVEKYPASLQFLLMTLGPALLLLSYFERWPARPIPLGWLARKLLIFGRVPMFYYLLHLYLIHIAALVVGLLFQQPVAWLWGAGRRAGYGHNLLFVYCVWILVIVILYFPCRWFYELKQRRKDWWLSYL
ncbi:MAG: heparan-alpha-glucosaminide N-acetyltransferase domain-containing protein [Acidobacteriota bacterium]